MRKFSSHIRRILALGMAFAVGVVTSVAVYAAGLPVASDIKLFLNGRESIYEIDGKQIPLLAYEGQTYIPIRHAAKLAKASVTYDEATRSIYLANNDPLILVSEPQAKEGTLWASASATDSTYSTFTLGTSSAKKEFDVYLGSQFDTLRLYYFFKNEWIDKTDGKDIPCSEDTYALVTVTNGETGEVIAVLNTDDVDENGEPQFTCVFPTVGVNFIHVAAEKVYRQ